MSVVRPFHRQRGFTFIEVMVSIGIFAVIATICYATLSQYLTVRDGVEKNRAALQSLQRTFTLLERDLRFMLARSVRDEYGDPESAFLLDDEGRPGELVRMTVSAPASTASGRTVLQRVSWRVADGDLYRDAWQVLDRVQDSEPVSRRVLSGIAQLEMRTLQWTDESGVREAVDPVPGTMPYGIELVVSLNNGKSYRRLFDLANGS